MVLHGSLFYLYTILKIRECIKQYNLLKPYSPLSSQLGPQVLTLVTVYCSKLLK